MDELSNKYLCSILVGVFFIHSIPHGWKKGSISREGVIMETLSE